jgi:hypothetical protein
LVFWDARARSIALGSRPFEQNLATFMPKWMAYEMRPMAERHVRDGMIPEASDVERVTKILDRPLHSYRNFAT